MYYHNKIITHILQCQWYKTKYIIVTSVLDVCYPNVKRQVIISYVSFILNMMFLSLENRWKTDVLSADISAHEHHNSEPQMQMLIPVNPIKNTGFYHTISYRVFICIYMSNRWVKGCPMAASPSRALVVLYQCLFSIKCLMYGILLLNLSAFLGRFCTRTFFFKELIVLMPLTSSSDLHTKLRIFNRSV